MMHLKLDAKQERTASAIGSIRQHMQTTNMLKKMLIFGGLTTVCLCLVACSKQPDLPSKSLRIATTTSTRDSGLLDELLSVFIQDTPCDISVIAVGTGAALKLGEQGEADLLIVHAPNSEQQFMSAKHGLRHAPFMKNEFIILGPSADPVNIRQLSPGEALQQIAAENHSFISRGDDSGTHKRELELWEDVKQHPDFEAYHESGQGMGNTLIIANQLQAYTLSDMATYLRFRDKIDLVPLVTNGSSLENRYSVITVNPAKNDKINSETARQFFTFLTSSKAAEIIADYQLHETALFTPLVTPQTP